MNAIEVSERVVSAIHSVASQYPNGATRRVWTKALKLAIGDIGLELEYEVLAGKTPDRPAFQAQWLYDLAWYVGDAGLQHLPLVLESEWLHDYERLREDFEKLLVAKAKIKVMIFESSTDQIQGKFSKLKHAIANFSDNCFGEVYIFACLDLDATPYAFVIEIVEVPDKLQN